MDRLTRKSECAEGRWTYECSSRKIIDKLAEYEDLEEQGRLLKFPVSVGDKVYMLCGDNIIRVEIERIIIYGSDICARYESLPGVFGYMQGEIYFSEFGKTWFSSEESAENTLKERYAE